MGLMQWILQGEATILKHTMTKRACSTSTLCNLYAKDHGLNESDGGGRGLWAEGGEQGGWTEWVDMRMDRGAVEGGEADGRMGGWTDGRMGERVDSGQTGRRVDASGHAGWTSGRDRTVRGQVDERMGVDRGGHAERTSCADKGKHARWMSE